MSPGKMVRCAIYTRKSSEEGLEQAFNSLHAQREACEAYIRSQRHEGWTIVPTGYDDGGFSGGTMERPALAALLEDVRAGRVHVIVVYKIDRLTRSLFDFARIVEILDAAGASFVSVTQSFNTTTSMGRLTLNVLLSFAQFEREVTGERIRDKIAASRRKGMWMGGTVPFGYDLQDHRLVPNEREAATVRLILETYLRLGSVRLLKTRLDALGLVTRERRRRRKDGTEVATGGLPFGVGHLYTILRNPIYLGRVRHKGTVYPGEHPAIVDNDLWSRVQARLDEQAVGRRAAGKGSRQPSLLTGIVHWQDGRRLTPTHAVKGARRYRYYATAARGEKKAIRLPAEEVERATLDLLARHLADPDWLAQALRIDERLPDNLADALARARAFAHLIEQPDVEAVRSILDRVALADNRIRLTIRQAAFLRQLGVASDIVDEPHQTILIEAATTIARKGRAQRLVIATATGTAARPEPTLIQAIVRARRWFRMLAEKKAASIADLARSENTNRGWISHQIALAFLAPDIVRSILAGSQPPSLTLERLIEIASLTDWKEQRGAIARL